MLITYLDDQPDIEEYNSLEAVQLAVETYNLDPAYYGTSWLVALPLVMKPTFKLPDSLPGEPITQGDNNGEQRSTRNRARSHRQE